MIDLLARDAASRFGITAILETEKIPYRPVATVGDATGPLVVATRDLSSAEIAALDGRAALVLHGGERFAREMLGAADATDGERAATLAVDGALWPASSAALARELGKHTLRLPPAPVCTTAAITRGRVLATLADGTLALAARDRCLWSAVDLGAAFTNLLTERAVPVRQETAASASALRVAARRLLEHAYYAAPEAMRRRVQRRWYAALERRLESLGDAASEYPIDAGGWLLTELVTALVRRVAGDLVRVARWPAPYRAAATLTHDVEPRRFAYTRGLAALLDAVATSGHAATFGLVARSSTHWLDDAAVARLGAYGVLCHGLAHRGENVRGRDDVRRDVETARRELERRLGRPVRGYRSPRLDRSPDLAWALDRAGFAFDSSYPDVDRENIAHFGGGVRLNVPYRPPIASDTGALRPSGCLELPLTAPDCIQPLFGGASIAELHAQVAAKAAYLRATGGLYVALVHGGVFGVDDQARRTAHLEFVAAELRRPEVWLASAEDVADWWCRREALRVADDADGVRITNAGTHALTGARVVVERDGGERTIDLPSLAPGATIAVADARALPAA
jgi:peptidoglycan/xylan/chitin deacetylase (PgdA/CDA1 family)